MPRSAVATQQALLAQCQLWGCSGRGAERSPPPSHDHSKREQGRNECSDHRVFSLWLVDAVVGVAVNREPDSACPASDSFAWLQHSPVQGAYLRYNVDEWDFREIGDADRLVSRERLFVAHSVCLSAKDRLPRDLSELSQWLTELINSHLRINRADECGRDL